MSEHDNIQEGFIKRAIRAVAGKSIARARSDKHHSAAMKGIVTATDKGRSNDEVGAAMKSSTRNRKAERAYSRAAVGRPIPKFGSKMAKEEISMNEDYSRTIVDILASARPDHNLRDVVNTALAERVHVVLNDYKRAIAENYFGTGSLAEQVAPELRRKPYQRVKQGLNTHNLTTYKKPEKKKTKPMNDAQRAIAADMRERHITQALSPNRTGQANST